MRWRMYQYITPGNTGLKKSKLTPMQKPIATLISNQHHLHPEMPDPVQVAYFLTESRDRMSLPVRKNDLFVITRFIKDSGHLTIDLSSYPIEPGRIFIIQPQSHYQLDAAHE